MGNASKQGQRDGDDGVTEKGMPPRLLPQQSVALNMGKARDATATKQASKQSKRTIERTNSNKKNRLGAIAI